MELVNILKVFRRWAWLIISIVILTGIALLLGLALTKPVYESQVKIQISTPQQEDVAVYDAQYRTVSSRDAITVARNNFESIIKGEEVQNRTFQRLNIDPKKVNFELELKSDSDSDFIFVIIRASSPTLAASIANALTNQAIDYYGELRAKPIVDEKALYAEQLQTAEKEYHTAANAMTLFKTKNNIVELTDEIATEQRILEQLQTERDQRLIDVKDSASQVKGLITQRQSELNRLLALEPMYLILEGNYQDAREEYRKALSLNPQEAQSGIAVEKYRKAEQAFNEYKTRNQVISLQSEISASNELVRQLQLELDQRLLIDADEGKVIAQVDEQILLHKKELERLSSFQSTYNVLGEKANEAQTKYQHILTKYTEAELTATIVRAAKFIQVTEPAHEPSNAVNNALKLLILGGLGSLGLGVILAFLLDYLFATSEEEVLTVKPDSQSVLGLPILGRIPVLETPLLKIGSPQAETIRQLRANIILSPTGHSLKTILITSPQSGDGKTLTTANLGVAMADGKSRILLVDADLRHPFLHEVFDQPNLNGMADLLSANNMLGQLISQSIRDTNIPGLSLLPAGHPPQDPSFLLSSHNTELIFEELSNKFDFVIVDSAPFFVAPDANILSKFMDGALLVLFPGKTSLQATEETVHSFKSSGFNLLGAVVNRASPKPYYVRHELKTGAMQKVLDFIPLHKTPLDPELISMEEAANMLGVRPKTVMRWCQNGQLKARRINWRWWVKRDDLQEFLKSRFGTEMILNY